MTLGFILGFTLHYITLGIRDYISMRIGTCATQNHKHGVIECTDSVVTNVMKEYA